MIIPPYLHKDYQYKKLKKKELLDILVNNNIDIQVSLNSRKSEILDVYKAFIHDKIDELKQKYESYGEMKMKYKKYGKYEDVQMSSQGDFENTKNLNDNIKNNNDVKNNNDIKNDDVKNSNEFKFKNDLNNSNESKIKNDIRVLDCVKINDTKNKDVKNKDVKINDTINDGNKSKKNTKAKEAKIKNSESSTEVYDFFLKKVQNKAVQNLNEKVEKKVNQKVNQKVYENIPIKNEPIKNEPIKNEPVKNNTKHGNDNLGFLDESKTQHRNPSMKNKFQRNSLNFPKSPSKSKSNIYQLDSAPETCYNQEKEKPIVSKSPQKTIKAPVKTKGKWFLQFFMMSIICLLVYIKFFCPYCPVFTPISSFIKKPYDFCINLPENGILRNGVIVCKKGFNFVKRFYAPDYCIKYEKYPIKRKIMNKVKTLIRKRNKEKILGLRDDNFFTIEEIESIIKNLQKEIIQTDKSIENIENTVITLNDIIDAYDDIRIMDDKVFSTKDDTFISLYLRYYFYKIVNKLSAPLFIFLIILFGIKAHIKKRKAKKEIKLKVDNIKRQIYNALMNQKRFYLEEKADKNYLTVRSLNDLFECEKLVWQKIKTKVQMSINVRCKNVGDEECWEWMGAIIDVDENKK